MLHERLSETGRPRHSADPLKELPVGCARASLAPCWLRGLEGKEPTASALDRKQNNANAPGLGGRPFLGPPKSPLQTSLHDRRLRKRRLSPRNDSHVDLHYHELLRLQATPWFLGTGFLSSPTGSLRACFGRGGTGGGFLTLMASGARGTFVTTAGDAFAALGLTEDFEAPVEEVPF